MGLNLWGASSQSDTFQWFEIVPWILLPKRVKRRFDNHIKDFEASEEVFRIKRDIFLRIASLNVTIA